MRRLFKETVDKLNIFYNYQMNDMKLNTMLSSTSSPQHYSRRTILVLICWHCVASFRMTAQLQMLPHIYFADRPSVTTSELETSRNTCYASFILFMRLIIYAHNMILTEINCIHYKSGYSYQPGKRKNLRAHVGLANMSNTWKFKLNVQRVPIPVYSEQVIPE